MSMYDDTNPQHLEHRERWRAIGESVSALPRWSVELHDGACSKYTVFARTMDEAHRGAEAQHEGRLMDSPGPFKFGATIIRIK